MDILSRRHFFAAAAGLLPAAASQASARAGDDLIGKAATLVKVKERWGADHLYEFLGALPDEGRLSIKKSLNIVDQDTGVEALKGKSRDMREIQNQFLWVSHHSLAYPFTESEGVDYHEVVGWLAGKAGVSKTKIDAGSTFAIERALMQQLFADLWDRLDTDRRLELLDKIDPNQSNKDRAAIAALSGAGALSVLTATVTYAGFGFYTAMSTAICTAAGWFGVTLPFAAYTGSSSAVAFLTGPAGWAIIAVAAAAGVVLAGRANPQQTAAFILQLHALKVAALRVVETPEDSAFPPSVKYPGGGRLEANRRECGQWEKFRLVEHTDGTISLAAYTGFLCAEEGGGAGVVANRDEIGKWEKWTLVRNADGTVSLRSVSGHFLCVEDDDNTVTADRTSAGTWERFTMTYADGKACFLRSWNNKYVSAQPVS